jgi:hypothetical protein
MFSFSPQGSSETSLILRRTQRDITRKLHKSLCKVPVILLRFQSKLDFPQNNFEKYSNVKFSNNPYSKSGMTSRQTDMTKLIVAFPKPADGKKKKKGNAVANLTPY